MTQNIEEVLIRRHFVLPGGLRPRDVQIERSLRPEWSTALENGSCSWGTTVTGVNNQYLHVQIFNPGNSRIVFIFENLRANGGSGVTAETRYLILNIDAPLSTQSTVFPIRNDRRAAGAPIAKVFTQSSAALLAPISNVLPTINNNGGQEAITPDGLRSVIGPQQGIVVAKFMNPGNTALRITLGWREVSIDDLPIVGNVQ
jgi:hypothetical protein